MKILYIIGNGLDIALMMKTRQVADARSSRLLLKGNKNYLNMCFLSLYVIIGLCDFITF